MQLYAKTSITRVYLTICVCANAIKLVSEPDPPRSVTSYVRTYDVTERGGCGSETTIKPAMVDSSN